jgi:hypothetical protein
MGRRKTLTEKVAYQQSLLCPLMIWKVVTGEMMTEFGQSGQRLGPSRFVNHIFVLLHHSRVQGEALLAWSGRIAVPPEGTTEKEAPLFWETEYSEHMLFAFSLLK